MTAGSPRKHLVAVISHAVATCAKVPFFPLRIDKRVRGERLVRHQLLGDEHAPPNEPRGKTGSHHTRRPVGYEHHGLLIVKRVCVGSSCHLVFCDLIRFLASAARVENSCTSFVVIDIRLCGGFCWRTWDSPRRRTCGGLPCKDDRKTSGGVIKPLRGLTRVAPEQTFTRSGNRLALDAECRSGAPSTIVPQDPGSIPGTLLSAPTRPSRRSNCCRHRRRQQCRLS